MVSVYGISDLHGRYDRLEISEQDDLVLLAGDIGRTTAGIRLAGELADHHNVDVVVVAGNHEFYGDDYGKTLAQLRSDGSRHERVRFLENSSFETCYRDEAVRILGCTLWSDFTLNGPELAAMHAAAADIVIPDFRHIRFGGRRFTPDDVKELFKQSTEYLRSSLEQPFDGKTVVVTHFAPHPVAIHPVFAADGAAGDSLTPYFVSDLSELITDSAIDLWFFGHTHHSVDCRISGTRLVSNQQGYRTEPSAVTGFDPAKRLLI